MYVAICTLTIVINLFSVRFGVIAEVNIKIYRFMTIVHNKTIIILDIIHRHVFYLKLKSTL
jgi:hypothetical protein